MSRFEIFHGQSIGLLGISGNYGQINSEIRDELLSLIARNYNLIDTASVYGEPERINTALVRVLASADLQRPPVVINKIGAELQGISDDGCLIDEYESQKQIFSRYPWGGLLLHRPNMDVLSRDIKFYKYFRASEPRTLFGICTNNTKVLNAYCSAMRVDLVQVAINFLDYRSNLGLIQACRRSNVHVQARSVLSSGLLAGRYVYSESLAFSDPLRRRFCESERNKCITQKRLDAAGRVLRVYKEYSKHVERFDTLTFPQFVYACSLRLPGIDSILRGGSTRAQIVENSKCVQLTDIEMLAPLYSDDCSAFSAPYL